MRKEPQIFTTIDRKNTPVDLVTLDAIKDDEITEIRIPRHRLRSIIRETIENLSPTLQDEITRAKFRGVSRNDVNSVLSHGGDDDYLALKISVLRRTLREAEESTETPPAPFTVGYVVDSIKALKDIEEEQDAKKKAQKERDYIEKKMWSRARLFAGLFPGGSAVVKIAKIVRDTTKKNIPDAESSKDPILMALDIDDEYSDMLDDNLEIEFIDAIMSQLDSLDRDSRLPDMDKALENFVQKKHQRSIDGAKITNESFTRDDFRDVYATARMAHTGQKRRSGEDYFSHPSEVRNIVARLYPADRISQLAALLHDSLEDAPGSTVESAEEMEVFIRGSISDPSSAEEVIRVVRALTHEKGGDYLSYVVSLMQDQPALRVKLADMIHNLSSSPSAKQKLKYKSALNAISDRTTGNPPDGISQKHWDQLFSLVEGNSSHIDLRTKRIVSENNEMKFEHNRRLDTWDTLEELSPGDRITIDGQLATVFDLVEGSEPWIVYVLDGKKTKKQLSMYDALLPSETAEDEEEEWDDDYGEPDPNFVEKPEVEVKYIAPGKDLFDEPGLRKSPGRRRPITSHVPPVAEGAVKTTKRHLRRIIREVLTEDGRYGNVQVTINSSRPDLVKELNSIFADIYEYVETSDGEFGSKPVGEIVGYLIMELTSQWFEKNHPG